MRSNHFAMVVAVIASGCLDFDSGSADQGCGSSDFCNPEEPLLDEPLFGEESEDEPLVSDGGELEMEGPFCSGRPVVCGPALATGSRVSVGVAFHDRTPSPRRLWTSDEEVIEVRDPSFHCLATRATLVAHRPGTSVISLVRAVDREPKVVDGFTLRVEDADHIEIRTLLGDGVTPLVVGDSEFYTPAVRAADGTVLATTPSPVTWRTSDASVIAIQGTLHELNLMVSVLAVGPGVADVIAETDIATGSLTVQVE